MSDTPKTDEQELAYIGEDGSTYVHATFARQLERELAEAKAEIIRIAKERNEEFQFRQEARRQFREGTWHGNTTEDYMNSVYAGDSRNMFDLSYQWQDKPHRHVSDLCDWVNALQDEIKELRK